MRRELQKYKKNTFDKLTITFNNDKKALTIYFNNLINFVLKSRLSQNVKIVQINILRSSYITHLNKLTNTYNNEVNRINAYQPTIQNTQTIQNIPNTPTIQNIVTNFKNKNALLIGCNYNNTSYKLNGCINDVNNIKSIINKTGFNNINILTDETDKKPNKSNILSELTKLLTNSNNNDLLFFLYSGHGSQVVDKNGDETDSRDEVILPLDFNVITDDELKTVIQTYLKPNVTLFALFDCCNSGTVLDLKYQYLDSLNYDNYTENNKATDTPGNVIMISGCTDKQTSADAFINNISQGAMTWAFIESINSNPKLSWKQLIQNMRKLLTNSRYSQIPQLSTGQKFNIDTAIFI
jgi:hypothetical protein